MGRMKSQSARFMQKMSQKAARQNYFKEQKKMSEAIVDLTNLRIHVRELVDMSETGTQIDWDKFKAWREKAQELLLKE